MKIIDFPQDRDLDIIVIGRAAIDMNPAQSDRFDEGCKPLKDVHYFEMFVGGSSANIALGLAKNNLSTGFLGTVSDDQLGDFVTAFLKDNGVDTSHISRCQNNIALTFTEILPDGFSNLILFRKDPADLQFSLKDVDEDYIAKAKAILITGTALSAEPSRQAVMKCLSYALKHNTKVIFDIDYRPQNWKNEEDVEKYCSPVAKESDMIFGSREEFDLLEKNCGLNMSDEDSFVYWNSYKAKVCLFKHGHEGSTAFCANGEKYKVRPFHVQARKRSGGGDGYAAAFLYGMMMDWDFKDCLEAGSGQAAMMIANNSCSTQIPTIKEVLCFIKEEKEIYGEAIFPL